HLGLLPITLDKLLGDLIGELF
ncbi:hypothetical protein D018_3005B, partial [Vibrio parahaemolyticus VP2007-007]